MSTDPPTDFSRDDIHQIRALLDKAETAHQIHIFTADEVEILRRVIDTFESHEPEIMTILKREKVSKLWAELRLRWWSIIKWALGAFLLITAAASSWRGVVAPIWEWFRK